MDTLIRNSTDLKFEIERLKASKKIQEEAIVAHFKSPSAIIGTIVSMFKGSPATDIKGSLLGNQDIYGLVSRVLLPFILNKTVFRGSNFLIKTAVGLLSQKASGFINEKSIATTWNRILSLIPGRKPTKKHANYAL